MADLIEMREETSSIVLSALKEAEEYQDSFEKYSYLWVDDLQESMRNFLIHGHAVSPEDLDTRVEEVGPRTPPTLAQFQQQVRGSPAPSLTSNHPPPPRGGCWGWMRNEVGFIITVVHGGQRTRGQWPLEKQCVTPSSQSGCARPCRATWVHQGRSGGGGVRTSWAGTSIVASAGRRG